MKLLRAIAALWHDWAQAWNRREPPTILALVRIGIAFVLLVDLLYIWRYDLVTILWAEPSQGGIAISATGGARSQIPAVRWWGATPETAQMLWTVWVVACVAMILGAGTRLAALTFVFCSAQLGRMAPDSERGIDIMLRMVVLVIAFSPSHYVWSVDAWFRKLIRRPYPELAPSWARYLIFAQVIWMYFSAAQAKFDPDWGPLGSFSALGKILCDPHFVSFEPGWTSGIFYPITQLATAGTMAFEWTAPAFILATWYARTPDRPGKLRRFSNRFKLRWLWILTGVSFHVGIAVTMRLGIFPWGMLVMYPVFFHPEELQAGLARLRARLGRGGSGARAA